MSDSDSPDNEVPEFKGHEAVRRLLDIDSPAANEWTRAELAELLEFQLKSSIALDVAAIDPVRGLGVEQFTQRIGKQGISFERALFESPVELELLKAIKWFAKRNLVAVDPALPRPIAVFLYNMAIVNARQRHDVRISGTADREIEASLNWLLHDEWISGMSRSRVIEALNWLANQPPAR